MTDRGARARLEVEEAWARLEPRVHPLATELVPVTEAAGRVAAEAVRAAASVPHFRRSAMDGFALRAEDLRGASPETPARLTLVGDARPGRAFAGAVPRGAAVSITTGAPVPADCDAVVMVELSEERAQEGTREVLVFAAIPAGKHVAEVGEDVARGALVVPRGRRLRPQDAGLLASVGCGAIPVIRRPRVALVLTGDELLPPGSTPEGAHIVDANSVVLAALARRDGALVTGVRYVGDDPARTAAALGDADADVVLVSGGSSIGPEDHAARVLSELGELLVHGVALRPGAPTGFGFAQGRLVFLLPGNPVACLCTYELFAGRAIRILGGISADFPHIRVVLPLASAIRSELGRTDYVRVRIEDGRVVPIMAGGASILSSSTVADGAVFVGSKCAALAAGELVQVWLYDGVASA
jgi:molybdopterin molybdotransferase